MCEAIWNVTQSDAVSQGCGNALPDQVLIQEISRSCKWNFPAELPTEKCSDLPITIN